MITSQYAGRIRFAIRSVLIAATAFGLRLSAEQVAAVQLVAEAALQLIVRNDG